MLTTLAALAIFAAPAHLSTVELFPTEDIWAYPHATDPDRDPFLRIWGFEGVSVANSADESESFGYSFLKFDIGALPNKALKGATLVLVHVAKPPFTLEMAKQSPIEARPMNADFSEKKWSYHDLSKFMPRSGKESLYGTGAPASITEDKDFTITLDLAKGTNSFAKALEESRVQGTIAIALTTTLSPNEEARAIYKVYSKDGPKELRPLLRLEFEND